MLGRPLSLVLLMPKVVGEWSHIITHIYIYIWMFPKIRGTFLGAPIIRTIVFWCLYRGHLILGNYHIYIYVDIHIYI